MTAAHPQFSLAMTHVFKGMARLTRVGEQTKARAVSREDEGRRRTRLLEELCDAYSVETGVSAGASGALPPHAWVNERLESLGQRWRVHNVDGYRCEIYDV